MARTSKKKFVYFFGGGKAEGMKVARDEKGRKASSAARARTWPR